MEQFLLVNSIMQLRGASVSVLTRTVPRLNVPHDMIRPDSHDFH